MATQSKKSKASDRSNGPSGGRNIGIRISAEERAKEPSVDVGASKSSAEIQFDDATYEAILAKEQHDWTLKEIDVVNWHGDKERKEKDLRRKNRKKYMEIAHGYDMPIDLKDLYDTDKMFYHLGRRCTWKHEGISDAVRISKKNNPKRFRIWGDAHCEQIIKGTRYWKAKNNDDFSKHIKTQIEELKDCAAHQMFKIHGLPNETIELAHQAVEEIFNDRTKDNVFFAWMGYYLKCQHRGDIQGEVSRLNYAGKGEEYRRAKYTRLVEIGKVFMSCM